MAGMPLFLYLDFAEGVGRDLEDVVDRLVRLQVCEKATLFVCEASDNNTQLS
jgi:hypothetical protein